MARRGPPGSRARRQFGDLVERLQSARSGLATLDGLPDAALDAIPPATGMRFADGKRSLEPILRSVLKHQQHQVEAIAAHTSRA